MNASPQKRQFEGFDGRLNLLALALVVSLALLATRLWYLQIIHGDEYERQAENNRLDFELLRSPRGIIYGRDQNTVLADNRAASDLVLTPAQCENPEEAAHLLAEILDVDAPALLDEIEKALKLNEPYKQITVKRDITRSERTRIEERSFALPGVYTVARPQRRYYYGETAGQLLGWLNEIDENTLNRLKPRYKMGDVIGRAGLEMMYEETLKGSDGAMIVSRYNGSVPQLRTDEQGVPYIEVDSRGRALEVQSRQVPVPGEAIFTTIDIGLQREAERILNVDLVAEGIVDHAPTGAIVVLNADTGEVLAMASTPGYDPSIFVTNSPDRGRLVSEALGDKRKPMLSRAFQFHYPPGSVFKIVLAIAGLEEGVIDEHSTFGCNGYFRLPGVDRPWRCWRLKYGGHGGVNVVDALAYSCDVFFYKVGEKLGPEKIKAWSDKLGFGLKTGIDLPGEVPGLIPDPEWKRQEKLKSGETDPWELKWYPGETINMSIGQGTVVTTPLQNAVVMAAVINGGKRVRPYVNAGIGPSVTESLVSDKTLRIVEEGMRKCIEKKTTPSGTGKEAQIDGLDILGKTGTAQVASMKHISGMKESEIPYEIRDHALFVAGVTDQKPRLAVSVIIEHGLHGSSAAAPVARKIFEFFYKHKSGTVPEPITIAMQEGDE